MERRLLDKVALVTGGGRGIGLGIAKELARAGAAVAVNDVVPYEEGQDVVRQVAETGKGRAVYAPADVADRPAVEAMVEEVERELGPIEVVVSNAVVSKRHTFLETSTEELQRAVEVAIFGAFHVVQTVARRWVSAGRHGAVVQITSPLARLPYRASFDYVAAKSGVHHMALAMANELAYHGIRVNLVEPGWTDTPGEHQWFSDEVLARAARDLPLGRLCTPEDVGRAVVFAAAEPYMVANVIRVDGGHSLSGYAPAGDDPRRLPTWP